MGADEVIERLRAERNSVVQLLASMTAELSAVAAASAGSNLDDEHDPEGATVAFEREQLSALRAHAQRQLVDLDAAIDRAGGDRYGRCESCGRPIGDERLDAVPATRWCVRCASLERR